jgi:hypothetical protein
MIATVTSAPRLPAAFTASELWLLARRCLEGEAVDEPPMGVHHSTGGLHRGGEARVVRARPVGEVGDDPVDLGRRPLGEDRGPEPAHVERPGGEGDHVAHVAGSLAGGMDADAVRRRGLLRAERQERRAGGGS